MQTDFSGLIGLRVLGYRSDLPSSNKDSKCNGIVLGVVLEAVNELEFDLYLFVREVPTNILRTLIYNEENPITII
jgi:hypothetical protein